MTKEAHEPQDLSKSRTVAIVNGSVLSRDAIQAAIESLNQPNNATKAPTYKPASGQSHSASADSYEGKVIDDKYKILGLLGQGGMAAVYLAHHISLNKDVALKTFHERNMTDDNHQRFQREAQSIGRLQHKNIVQVFDFGITSSGAPYYTMEVLEGENVAERIDRKGQLEQKEALMIFSELCQGLSICHQRKIVHRDIKPSNIFLALKSTTSDTIQSVKIVDFGIAALVDDDLEAQRLTALGTVFGSPLYMSPEQSMGQKVDARSDIYSAGCALFEMLTGRAPFCAASAFATMLCHQQAPIPTLASTRLIAEEEEDKDENEEEEDDDKENDKAASPAAVYPEWLEGLVASMLAKDPKERVQTLDEVLDVINYNKHNLNDKTTLSSTNVARVKQNPTLRESTQQLAVTGGKILLLVAAISIVCAAGVAIAYFGGQNSEPKASDKKEPVIAQPTAAPIKQLVAKVPPFKLKDSHDGKIHFHFPKTSIGEIGFRSDTNLVKAQGDITFPFGEKIFFKAQSPIFERPELLLGFGEDDLHGLALDQLDLVKKWDRKSLQYIHHLKSLEKFSASMADLSEEAIEDLNELPKLADLSVDGCSMKGSDLLKLKSISQLECLTISSLSDCGPLLKQLTKKSKLRHLAVDSCGLTDNDMINIGKLKTLGSLIAGANHITNKSLPALLDLPKLDTVKLKDNPITAEALPIILKLKPVRYICLPAEFYTPKAVKAMDAKFGEQNCNNLAVPEAIKDAITPLP